MNHLSSSGGIDLQISSSDTFYLKIEVSSAITGYLHCLLAYWFIIGSPFSLCPSIRVAGRAGVGFGVLSLATSSPSGLGQSLVGGQKNFRPPARHGLFVRPRRGQRQHESESTSMTRVSKPADHCQQLSRSEADFI
ncbi:unnamed protein product [Protopolystoma xenopodis]|uniref:Uncharacterized protein n=1 Tax=Protopolystoma xenopodis TaxID=117903 RepID=A0A448X2K2_9PLAT|nr:unnamed protein product [Protopolystoma xenopodis]